MSVIARFEVIPVRDGSMSTAIASALRALDRHPVSYETTATDTIIEADTVDQVFAAVQAAHQAIPEDRVITSVEIDEDRRRPQNMNERVASVERELGHPPQRRQGFQPQGAQAGTGPPPAGQQMQQQAGGQQPRGQSPGRPTQTMQSTPTGQSGRTARPARDQPSGQPNQNQPTGRPIRSRPPGPTI